MVLDYYLLAIAVHGDVGDLSIFASGVGAGVYEYLADESVALEAGFAFTIVVGLRHHLSVRHAVGVFITVVLFTRVNRFTHESVSVKSLITSSNNELFEGQTLSLMEI